MLLPMFDGLIRTTPFDPEMAALADRHYSRRSVGNRQFLYNGRKLVLRDAPGTILFGWMWPRDDMRMDAQTGYNCAIFRNESQRKGSEIILEAEELAKSHWGPNRFYTYVDPRKVRTQVPGYCFIRAGYKRIGMSKAGALLFAKEPA